MMDADTGESCILRHFGETDKVVPSLTPSPSSEFPALRLTVAGDRNSGNANSG
jgi:hypothetical protein